jgi:hypothetical protein
MNLRLFGFFKFTGRIAGSTGGVFFAQHLAENGTNAL